MAGVSQVKWPFAKSTVLTTLNERGGIVQKVFSEKASAKTRMRQECVRNAPRWVLFDWERGTFQNASEMRQNLRGTPLGENTFLDDTDRGSRGPFKLVEKVCVKATSLCFFCIVGRIGPRSHPLNWSGKSSCPELMKTYDTCTLGLHIVVFPSIYSRRGPKGVFIDAGRFWWNLPPFFTPDFHCLNIPSQQEKIHAHSFVFEPEFRIQYTYTYMKNSECHRFWIRYTYLALFATIYLVTDMNTHTWNILLVNDFDFNTNTNS